MSWLTFRNAVLAAFESALPPATLAVTPVNWAGGAREMAEARLLLEPVSEVEIFVRDGDVFDAGLSSINDVTVQVTAESTYDSSDLDARQLLELARLGLRRKAVLDGLAAANVSLVEIPMAPRNVGFSAGNRRVSAWAFDATFRYVLELAANPLDDFGLIETVQAAGEVSELDETLDPIEVTLEVVDPEPEP
jgi:hypothetical protein